MEVVRMLCKVDLQEPEAEVNVRILVLILISMQQHRGLIFRYMY